MDLSTLIKGSKNSLSKKAAICMTAFAITAPLFMQHVYAGPVNVNTVSQSELESICGLGPSQKLKQLLLSERRVVHFMTLMICIHGCEVSVRNQ